MDWPADKIERRKVDALIPYARNARTHSDDQVAQIAASIKEWGWTTPVLIDEDGGIIAGHGRVMAARKLGIKQIPTMTATGWSHAQKQAYVLADNQLPQNAEWDLDLLAVEMKDLDADGFDLSLIGFGIDYLDSISVEPLDAFPSLPDGDKAEFQQITFTLHNDQAEQVQAAIGVSKGLGPFPGDLNENSNGNAIDRICEMFMGQHGNS
jgi:ParB-like chromosome segregation protein Spo0J